jgi:hypothetical protein
VATYYRGFGDADGISDFTEIAIASGTDAPVWSVINTDQVQATSASAHAELLAWNDIDSDADRANVEVVGQVYVDSTSTTQRWYMLRCTTSGTRTGYSVRVRTTSIDVYRSTGTTYTSISGATISISSGTWAWVRFRINSTGNILKAKVWTGAAGDEPGTWDVDTTDSTYSTSGHVGLLKGNNTNTQLWRYFGVGTNGDTAPTAAGGGTNWNLPASGGVSLSGAATYAVTSAVTLGATGGVVFSGTANYAPASALVLGASGGVDFSGTAPYETSNGASNYTLTSSGGVVFSGASDFVKNWQVSSSGGPVFSGIADYLTSGAGSFTLAAGGAATFSGDASLIPHGLALGSSGGVTFSGTATPMVVSLTFTSGGTVFFSGAASLNFQSILGGTNRHRPLTGVGQ